jgi:trehalose 6-phosphate phosphatase
MMEINLGLIESARKIGLYLDFDGTLAPIVPHPDQAKLPDQVRSSLLSLVAQPRITLAVVSGRSLADLEPKVGIPNIVYAGNHGFEISGKGLAFIKEAALEQQGRLAEILMLLRDRLQGIPRVEIEDKGLTASVHYRNVDPSDWEQVADIVAQQIEQEDHFLLRHGKMVLEIRPRAHWNKGEAVLWIRKQLHLEDAVEIYIGDDTTDEDAFMALPDGITIRVGAAEQTAARYTFRDTGEVASFLDWLAHQEEANVERQ